MALALGCNRNAVNGPFGVIARLARNVGVIDETGELGRAGTELLLAWAQDQGLQGFHAQVLSPAGTWYIDPYYRGDDSIYASYYKRDMRAPKDKFVEQEIEPAEGLLGLGEQRLDRLRTRIVKLAGLPDYDRACTNNEDGFYVSTFRHGVLLEGLNILFFYRASLKRYFLFSRHL